MSNESPVTALAASSAAPAGRSLLKELADAAGLDANRYYAMLKEVCGCREAKDEHFAALMMVAQGVGLNPVMAQMYLVPTQKGVKPVVGIDGYLVFLHRALKDGTIEYHDFEDGWFPDPRINPEKKTLRRGGKVTLKFKNRDTPVTHIEWLDEVIRDTGPWKQHQARMLRHKSYAQAIRYHLGLYVPDAEEAGALRGDEPRRVDDATISDAPVRPVVPITGLKPPGATTFAPPPAPLDAPASTSQPMPYEGDTMTHESEGKPEVAVSDAAPASSAAASLPPASPPSPAPEPLPDPQSEEGQRLARELDAEFARDEAKKKGGLFDA